VIKRKKPICVPPTKKKIGILVEEKAKCRLRGKYKKTGSGKVLSTARYKIVTFYEEEMSSFFKDFL
jgi:hypothetical protein